MSPIVAIGFCVLSAFEITVSPDQPLPYSYTDDPLIVEVRSDQPCTATIQLTATPDYAQPPQEATFERVNLGPTVSRWCAIKDLTTIRGPWSLDIAITVAGETEQLSETAYRIDRPVESYPHPIYAYGDTLNRNTLLALRSIAINTVRVPLTHPDLVALLDTFRTLGMDAIVRLDTESNSTDQARVLSRTHCEVIAAWAIAAPFDAHRIPDALEALRDLDCQKPIHVVLPDTPVLDAWLDQITPGQHLVAQGRPIGLTTLREELSIRGLNGITLDATVPDSILQKPERLLPTYFESLAQGAKSVAFPVELVYADGVLQPGLASINGLMHRVAPGAPAGPIAQAETTRAQVFSTGKRWFTVAWRTNNTDTVELPWSDKHPFSLMDAWGNGLESTSGESNWTHPLTKNFLYISGLGGPVLQTALVDRAKAYARRATEDSALNPAWSQAVREALAIIAADPADISSRVQFFTVLRAFPEIEERWHEGQLTRPVATTALARLATLGRTLCQLEAALGASFLEPLPDTLARCEAFQSAYLTGSTTTPQARKRGDALVAEVRRLMDEAEALAQVDRRIEADAVAALAEWRARALEFAAKAGPRSDQLTLPEDESGNDETVATDDKKRTKK